MKTTTARHFVPDEVVAGVRSAVAGLSIVDTHALLAVAKGGGSVEDVEARVSTAAAREGRERLRESVVLAPHLDAVSQRGAVSALLRAAESTTPGEVPDLRQSLGPQLEELERRAAEAEGERDAVRGALTRTGEDLDANERRGRQYNTKHISAAKRREKLTELKRKLFACYAFETATVGVAAAGFLGILDQPITTVPLGLWLQAMAVTAGGVLSLFWVARQIAQHLPRLATGGRFTIAALVACFGGLAIAIGVIRALGAMPMNEVGTEAASVGSGALFVLSTVVSAVLSLIAAGLHRRVHGTLQELWESEQAEAHFHGTAAQLGRNHETLRVQLTAHDAAIAAPGELTRWWSASFHDVVRAAEDWAIATRERVERNRAAFAALPRDPVALDAVAEEVISIERIAPEPIEPVAASDAAPRAHTGIIALLLASTALGSADLGCAEAEPPAHTFVVCDGTGGTTEVCSNDLLQRVLYDAAMDPQGHLRTPDSKLTVIVPGPNYATTVVHDPIRVPARWQGNPRAARVRWLRTSLSEVGKYAIPALGDDSQTIQSDLLDSLAILARLTRDGAEARQVLVASDGFHRGTGATEGLDFGEDIPPTKRVLKVLRAQGGPWDLNGTAIRWCGIGAGAPSAAAAVAVERLWRELLHAAGVEDVEFHASCATRYPALPVGLVPRDQANDGQEVMP